MSLYKLHKHIAFIRAYRASNLKVRELINSHKVGKRLPARVKARLIKEELPSISSSYSLTYKGSNKYFKKLYRKLHEQTILVHV